MFIWSTRHSVAKPTKISQRKSITGFSAQQKAGCVMWNHETDSMNTNTAWNHTKYAESLLARNVIIRWVYVLLDMKGRIYTSIGRPTALSDQEETAFVYFVQWQRRYLQREEKNKNTPQSTNSDIRKHEIYSSSFKLHDFKQFEFRDCTARLEFTKDSFKVFK